MPSCPKSGNRNQMPPPHRISRLITIPLKNTPGTRIAGVTVVDEISAAETAVAVVVEVVVASAVEAGAAAEGDRRADAICLLPSTLRRKAESARAIPEVTIPAATTPEVMTSGARNAVSSLANRVVLRALATPALPLRLTPAKNPSCFPVNRSRNIAESRQLQWRPPSLSKKRKNATTNLKCRVPPRRRLPAWAQPVFPGALPVGCRVGC